MREVAKGQKKDRARPFVYTVLVNVKKYPVELVYMVQLKILTWLCATIVLHTRLCVRRDVAVVDSPECSSQETKSFHVTIKCKIYGVSQKHVTKPNSTGNEFREVQPEYQNLCDIAKPSKTKQKKDEPRRTQSKY